MTSARREQLTQRDWDAVLEETVTHLRHAIQIDTTNPPGNELPLARYLASVLEDVGVETHLFEPTAGRVALVARIRGTGRKRPILLLAHMDVVGVEREQWSVDPFAGEVKDGFLYGRGAIDDKGMLLLARDVAESGVPLARDVLYVATSDEEAGGEWGIGWLAANHRELLDAEFALNEGGRTRVVNGVPLYVAVQTAEKVSNVVTVTARGPAGHAAIPLADNAVGVLGRAIGRLAEYREPVCLLPTTRAFFHGLSSVWPKADEAEAMRELSAQASPRAEWAAQQMARIPVFDAVLRNTISPTVIAGGIRHNVIPTEATAWLSVRTLPGESIEDVVHRLVRVADDPRVELAVTHRGTDAPASDHLSPMFAAISASVAELNPSLATLPYLSTGASDSAVLRSLGIQAYGVLPFPLDQSDEERMHGADERVPLESLRFGTRLLHGTVSRIASATVAGTPPA
jgi:acetylornithine deacetylase/succinyl-diaminopimelate desuccinylase-like protein